MRTFSDVSGLIGHLELLATLPSVETPAFTELDHGLQTAAILERTDPHDEALQVAGLLHDLAHPWDGPGQPRHARMGADAVRPLLGDRVAELIAAHVPAKRYLVATEPGYFAQLSDDSVMTLAAQGGPMDANEVADFERDDDWRAMVALRRADEGAKVPGTVVPGLDHWLPALHRVAAAEHFDRHGWALVDTLDADGVRELEAWIGEISAAGDATGVLQYRELTEDGPKLCRSENFVPFHSGIRALLTSGAMPATASALLGTPAVLYKEKINYKLAGGAGYSPHQDAPAYPFVDTHVSCMLAVDDADAENGCLEVVSDLHHEILPTDATGCIEPAVADALDWQPVPVRAGQALWFHSRAPHRSGPNRSSRDRRAVYPTYNARREGDLRDDYYAEKLARMASTTVGDHVQVSLIGDFQGRPV